MPWSLTQLLPPSPQCPWSLWMSLWPGEGFVNTGSGSLWTFFLTSGVNLWLSHNWNFHDVLLYLPSCLPCLPFALEASFFVPTAETHS